MVGLVLSYDHLASFIVFVVTGDQTLLIIVLYRRKGWAEVGSPRHSLVRYIIMLVRSLKNASDLGSRTMVFT